MSTVSSLQPVQSSSNVNFKGKEKITDNGNKYYATDMGGKFLGGVSAAEGVINVVTRPNKGASLIGGVIGTGINYAIGHYIDNKRNEHAAEAADYIQKVGARNALQTHDRIEVAENGHLYYKSNDGRKILTRLAAVVGGISGLIGASLLGTLTKNIKNMPKIPKAGAYIALPVIGAGIGALGGWINGAIVDWLNNRSARKHA